MHRRSPNVWHALGYHAERARSTVMSSGGGASSSSAPRNGNPAGDSDEQGPLLSSAAGKFLIATGASLVVRSFERWLRRKSPSLPGLLRGAAAGVGAAGLLAAIRHVIGVRTPITGPEPDLLDELLEGAGHGLVYAAILEPNLPGPPVLRGLLMGTAEHLAEPWGGVLGPLQGAAPHARVPGLRRLLSPLEFGARPLFDHLLYATVLAVLYGRRSRR